MSDPELIEALNRNTEAMIRLAVVWEKLHAKAIAVASRPIEEVGLNAAGVPIVRPLPAEPESKAEGFVL